MQERKNGKYIGRRKLVLHNTSIYVNLPPSWRGTQFADVYEVDESTILIKKVEEVGS
jgi:hypothetical protein